MREFEQGNSRGLARNPRLLREWHPTKNPDLAPSTVTSGSGKRVWWKCAQGPDHEWRAAVKDRVRGDGCPFCAGKRLSVTNSLAALYPEIAREWHPTRNGDLTPESVVAGSQRIVWWTCQAGPDHEWPARIMRRWHGGGHGCPFCAGSRVSVTNSLAARVPEVAAEWHPSKNAELTPGDVTFSSHRIVWWQCPQHRHHAWQAKINNRTSLNKAGCPYCSGNLLAPENSLAYCSPEVAAEWHPSKNGALTPTAVSKGSGRIVWWQCPNGPDHEWRAAAKSRVRGNGCPFCGNDRLSTTNSLAARFPAIAAQWHPTKNADLRPDQVVYTSHRKVWWQCEQGPDHAWQATVESRTGKRKTGCPACARQRVSGTNSLARLFPEIAAELHPTKSGGLSADRIVAQSGKPR